MPWPWPFGSGKSHEEKRPEPDLPKTVPWNDVANPADREMLRALLQWSPNILCSLGALGALHVYTIYLRRFPSAAYITPAEFRKRGIFGRVTSVGDGDGFHLFHTPGGRMAGWGWLRKIPTARAELKGRTIPIRIAGVDAPECAHFGKPGQPMATEALRWLRGYILNKSVRVKLHKRDQYDRIVATVFLRRWGFRRDVGHEMLKRGLATTYEAKTGAEFGGFEKKYKAAEAKAKAKKRGIWSGKAASFESPRAYKTRLGEGQDGTDL